MKLEVQAGPRMLEAVMSGSYSLRDAKKTFLKLLEAVEKSGAGKVLVDGGKLKGRPGTVERFLYGEFAANSVRNLVVRTGRNPRFAYLLRYPVRDPSKLGETVAVNRGMLVKVFERADDAVDWLES